MTDTPVGPASRGALVVGEALMDVLQLDSDPTEVPGGSPANVALGLARLEHDVHFLTSLALDDHGRRIARHLMGSGVRLLPESFTAERTSTAVAQVDDHGSARYEFDIAWSLPDEFVAPEVNAVHIGSISAFLQPGAAVARHCFATSTAKHKTFDPNIRPALLGSHAESVATFEATAALATLVKLSDEDAAWLYPATPPTKVAQRILDLGPGTVAITSGPRGAQLWGPRGAVSVAAPSVRMIDSIGAGDTFMASLLGSLLDTEGALDLEWMRSAGRSAVRAAAITVTRAGADLPTKSDLTQGAPIADLSPGREAPAPLPGDSDEGHADFDVGVNCWG